MRPNGISLLVPTQNAIKTVRLCLESFLPLADEIIVVDNGSTDGTQDIVRQFAAEHDRVRFYDRPELTDLWQNRQYAFERSRFRYVMRCDSDFIAYDRVRELRQRLLRAPRTLLPWAFPHANLVLDWWHTGLDRPTPAPHEPGRHVPPPITKSRLCIYEVFPGFRFERLGRGEGARFSRLMRYAHRRIREPYWMHCNIKTSVEYLVRSERTNWRELGDYVRYPTLQAYVCDVIPRKYGTACLTAAAEVYMRERFLPFVQPYDPTRWYPYPEALDATLAIR